MQQVEEQTLGESAKPTLIEAAMEAAESSRRQVSAILELLTLEVKYSGLMLASALAAAVVAALAIFSAWGLLMAALVAWLVAAGWSLGTALMVMSLFNVVLVVISFGMMRRCLKRIGVDGTRRALKLEVAHVSK